MIDQAFVFTVTVYHKITDRSSGRTVTSWERTVYKNCFFGTVSAEALNGTTVTSADSFVVRIPHDTGIVVCPGDVIVSGEVSDVIADVSGSRASDLVAKYKGNAFVVNSVSVNNILPYAQHIRASGV